MFGLEDEGSPFLGFLWDLRSVLHVFSGKLHVTKKFSNIFIIPMKGSLESREFDQEKKKEKNLNFL